MGVGINIEMDDKALLERIAEFSLRMLRKEGYDRESMKEMADRVCNEVPRGDK
jgi:hypothetical protein